MAYEPKTWVCGEKITADDLNHMEEGIANAGGGGGTESNTFAIRYNADSNYAVTCDKTFAEIEDAYTQGKDIVAYVTADFMPGITLTAVMLEHSSENKLYSSFLRAVQCGRQQTGLQEFHVTHYSDGTIVPGYSDVVACSE